jgi:hypothetical protein
MSRHDYKVAPVTEQEICSVTVDLWRLLGAMGQAEFPLHRALDLFSKKKISKNGILNISPFRATSSSGPARVVFNPELILLIDEERLELLQLGCPETRWIVAHELGHIVMHDSHAKAFSSDPTLRIKFAQPENSAEEQADLFAYYLLMPDPVVKNFRTPDLITQYCNVETEIALRRLDIFRRKFKKCGF